MPDITSLRFSVQEEGTSPLFLRFDVSYKIDVSQDDLDHGGDFHVYLVAFDSMNEARTVVASASGPGYPVPLSVPPQPVETLLHSIAVPIPPLGAPQQVVENVSLSHEAPAGYETMVFRVAASIISDRGPFSQVATPAMVIQGE